MSHPENLFTDPLDRLLAEAMALQAARKIRGTPAEKVRPSRTLFVDPENWVRTRGIALTHKSPSGMLTLLGNFSEYTHKSVKLARKLIREEAPIPVDSIEYVTGSWWISAEIARRIEPSESVKDLELTMPNLSMKELEVQAQAVPIKIRLLDGAFFRVELLLSTPFFCPSKQTILYFPAGLDILESLDMPSKVSLRKMIDQVLAG